MSAWYRELDPLPGGVEQVVPAEMSLHVTVRSRRSQEHYSVVLVYPSDDEAGS